MKAFIDTPKIDRERERKKERRWEKERDRERERGRERESARETERERGVYTKDSVKKSTLFFTYCCASAKSDKF